MRFRTIAHSLLGTLVLCGCVDSAQSSADLARARATVSFETEDAPDLTGFAEHWSLGSRSAWYSTSRREVLVPGPTRSKALRISGFPRELGAITAAGWEDDGRFFVHLSAAADTGTMLYIDHEKREVIEVKRWNAW